MSDATRLINDLRRIAKVSYGATIEEAKSVSNTQREAADLIEQQAKDIAALREDIEAQIRIASEEATRADGLELALREIAAIENQYDGGDWDEIERIDRAARAAEIERSGKGGEA
ncbi:hypothetical protein SB783_32170 [Paraburkholderia sp. SIMBA_009]